MELAKANPEVFVEYLNYKKDILKSIDAERLAHEKEIELQKVEVERSKLEIEKSKIEHEKTYNMFESRTNCIMSLICNGTYLLTNFLNSRNQPKLSDEQIVSLIKDFTEEEAKAAYNLHQTIESIQKDQEHYYNVKNSYGFF